MPSKLTRTFFVLAWSADDAREAIMECAGNSDFRNLKPDHDVPHPDGEAVHGEPGRYAVVVERTDFGHDAEYRTVDVYRCFPDDGVQTDGLRRTDEVAMRAAIAAMKRARETHEALSEELPASGARGKPRL